ncbi:hypothetical protein [Propionispira raffinosivorans]|uniref:hypothetical protein n=1 Tax=Propionispira raffinosivorans TaxID=86959 RepID=UPI00036F8AE5|nr:hypothetical protein [Propionispira raffinosivorans]
MRKFIRTLIIILILASLGSFAYRSSYDNRSASNLSAYCNIDFRSIIDPSTNKISQVTLSLLDFRFSKQPLESFCRIDIDGKEYQLDAFETASQAPTYSLQDFSNVNSFKYTNHLIVAFPPQIQKEIAAAKQIKISFQYKGNPTPIELPLSDVDLTYWKKQLLLL